MRPYKIPTTSRWVDLDTIQSIDEPDFDVYSNVYMEWQHAFRDKHDRIMLASVFEVTRQTASFLGTSKEYSAEMDRREAEWKKTACARCKAEVFDPFFAAWVGK